MRAIGLPCRVMMTVSPRSTASSRRGRRALDSRGLDFARRKPLRFDQIDWSSSTGPRMERGRARASRDARRHGLSVSVVSDPGCPSRSRNSRATSWEKPQAPECSRARRFAEPTLIVYARPDTNLVCLRWTKEPGASQWRRRSNRSSANGCVTSRASIGMNAARCRAAGRRQGRSILRSWKLRRCKTFENRSAGGGRPTGVFAGASTLFRS
jgi:hypothetical protein